MAKSALKFKDSVAAYEKLAQEIAARRFAPVYLLMGEESYFIDAIAERLATTVLGEAERAFNQITVYGKDSEAGQVINLCRQMPMMGSYQVVILKEAQQLRGLDKLSLYTQKPSPTATDIPAWRFSRNGSPNRSAGCFRKCRNRTGAAGVIFAGKPVSP